MGSGRDAAICRNWPKAPAGDSRRRGRAAQTHE